MVHFSEKRRGSRREKNMVVFPKGQCERRNKYELENNSLVVIDMENAFISKESPLCIQEAAKSVPACGRVIRKARRKRDSGILCEPHLSQKRQ